MYMPVFSEVLALKFSIIKELLMLNQIVKIVI